MSFQFHPLAYLPLTAAPIALILAYYAWRQHRQRVPGALAVALMLVAAAIWSLGGALELIAQDRVGTWLAVHLTSIGRSAVPLTLLLVTLTYAGRRRWLGGVRLLLLLLIPAATVILGVTNDLHGLMWKTPLPIAGGTAGEIYGNFGVARWINFGYSYLLVAVALGLLLTLRRGSGMRLTARARIDALLGGLVLTLAANIVSRLWPQLLPIDLTPIFFTVSGLALTASVVQVDWSNLLRLARLRAGDAVPTPILVLDQSDHIADLNRAAQKQFGLSRELAIGRPLSEMFPNSGTIIQALKLSHTAPVEVRLNLAKEARVYLLKASKMTSPRGRYLGSVTVWHDITERRQAERARQENEAFLRQIIDSNPHHIAVHNPEGRLVMVNRAKADYHGRPVEAFLGKTEFELFADPAAADATTRMVVEVLANSRSRQSPPRKQQGPGGRDHWFETTMTPLHAGDGSKLGVLSIATDVTRQKEFERRIDRQIRFEQLVNRISGDFINQTPSTFDRAVTDALQAIAGFVKADSVSIVLLQEDQAVLSQMYTWHVPEIDRAVAAKTAFDRSRSTWWLNRLRQGDTVFIPHLEQIPRAVRSGLQAEDARSLIAIPIIITGRLHGLVQLLWLQNPVSWEQSEVALLKFLGDLFANLLERRRTDDIVRDSERRFRLLAENATDLITLSDPAGNLTYLSPASETLLGYPPEELAGRPLAELVHPDDRDMLLDRIRDEPVVQTLRLRHRNGHHLWVERISRGIVDPESGKIVEVQSSARDISERVEAEQKLIEANLELNHAYDATIEGWARALELRDEETQGHSLRVTEMTVKLGMTLGLDEQELVAIRRGALLHDMGKLGVPDHILLKPGKLTDTEWEVMRQHPAYAYEWLKHVTFLRPSLDIPYSHHEKWDGSGYPQGLAGEEIPLAARMFAVVDVFDALTSDRPYRSAWTVERTLAHLKQQAGTHFDPRVVEVFTALVARMQHPVAAGEGGPAGQVETTPSSRTKLSRS